MPVRADDPLQRVTLNLYTTDVAAMKSLYGQGWTVQIRQLVNDHITASTCFHKVRRTLGDLE